MITNKKTFGKKQEPAGIKCVSSHYSYICTIVRGSGLFYTSPPERNKSKTLFKVKVVQLSQVSFITSTRHQGQVNETDLCVFIYLFMTLNTKLFRHEQPCCHFTSVSTTLDSEAFPRRSVFYFSLRSQSCSNNSLISLHAHCFMCMQGYCLFNRLKLAWLDEDEKHVTHQTPVSLIFNLCLHQQQGEFMPIKPMLG